MDAVIQPAELAGTVRAVASKSVAHRMLILAALADGRTDVDCNATSEDIEATIRCLTALGARIARTRLGFRVTPIPRTGPASASYDLDCGESGSTLRFMLPVVAALGVRARLSVHGRLGQRPLTDLSSALAAHGAELSPEGQWPMEIAGHLAAGDYTLPGNVSSQYVTGILLAASVLDGPTRIHVSEPVESAPYIALTCAALSRFGIRVTSAHEVWDGAAHSCYTINPTSSPLASPGSVAVEGDWSNAAFWLAAGAICDPGVTFTGLDLSSTQGDRAMLAALALFGAKVCRSEGQVSVSATGLHGIELDVSAIPDLVPPLAAVAAVAEGITRLSGAARLRMKESDRLESVSAALRALGVEAQAQGDSLLIVGTPQVTGGTVDAAGDHRIAMLGAILASRASSPARILGASCVAKSYPTFFEDYAALGGKAELA